ncbi:hypothetical protein D9M72_482620 [compost metagenome]
MRFDRAEQPVAQEAAAVADAQDLSVLGIGVADLSVPFLNLPAQPGVVQQRLRGEAVHPADQILQAVRHHKVGAVLFECLDGGCGAAAQTRAKQQLQVPVGDVRVLLGAGEGELLFDNSLVQDEPGVAVLLDIWCGPQQPQGSQGVVTGQPGGGKPPAQRVEPQGRRPGQDPDGMVRPDGVPVLDALGVVPHAVTVHQPDACLIGDVQHPPVNVPGHPGDHLRGRRPQLLGPPPAHQRVVAADPATRDHHGLRTQLKLPSSGPVRGNAARRSVRCQHGAAHPGDRAAVER